jgi:hypothetical protein
MSPQITLCLSVLILQEDKTWVAQCLEYDIVAQGETIAKATQAFEKTLVGQIIIDVKHKKRPLEDIPSAPKFYWDKFENAERLQDKKPFHLPDYIPSVNARAEDLRVYA